jgi:hypothetical protein
MMALITTLAPLIGGFFMGMMRAHMEHKNQQMQLLMNRAGIAEKSRTRAMQITDKRVSWTRRTLALIFSCSLIGMVGLVFLYGFFYPEFTINVPKEVVKNTFLAALIPWVDPVQTTEYVQLQGLTIVMPLLVPISEAVLMIVGFYFGRK